MNATRARFSMIYRPVGGRNGARTIQVHGNDRVSARTRTPCPRGGFQRFRASRRRTSKRKVDDRSLRAVRNRCVNRACTSIFCTAGIETVMEEF